MGDHPTLPDLPLTVFLRLDRRLSSAAFAVLEAGVPLLCLQHHKLCSREVCVAHNCQVGP